MFSYVTKLLIEPSIYFHVYHKDVKILMGDNKLFSKHIINLQPNDIILGIDNNFNIKNFVISNIVPIKEKFAMIKLEPYSTINIITPKDFVKKHTIHLPIYYSFNMINFQQLLDDIKNIDINQLMQFFNYPIFDIFDQHRNIRFLLYIIPRTISKHYITIYWLLHGIYPLIIQMLKKEKLFYYVGWISTITNLTVTYIYHILSNAWNQYPDGYNIVILLSKTINKESSLVIENRYNIFTDDGFLISTTEPYYKLFIICNDLLYLI